jgi:prephenate dehydrogenase
MIGIIGFGRFGKLTATYLAEDFDVVVYDSGENAAGITATGARAVSLAEACRQKILILCVPISVLREKLQEFVPLLKPGTVVIDVCSVKVYPAKVMREMLPNDVSILATHPMFGPDSASDSLEGRKIVLCKVRIPEEIYRKIKRYLANKRLYLIETTPEEHDEQIAVSLALTHFIGRSLSAFGAGPKEIDTEGYQRLLHVLEVVENDTWQLFEDMNGYNPFAGKFRKAFMAAAQRVNDQLSKTESENRDRKIF